MSLSVFPPDLETDYSRQQMALASNLIQYCSIEVRTNDGQTGTQLRADGGDAQRGEAAVGPP